MQEININTYMKKITLLFLGIAALTITANAQDIIFKETFGTTLANRDGCVTGTLSSQYDASKCEKYADHVWDASSHVWNSGIVYTPVSRVTTNDCDSSGTTLNIRTNNPSSYTNASGNGNLYFNSNTTNSFTISGISGIVNNTYERYTLSFGIFGKNAGDSKKIIVQYSDNGGALTNIAVTNIAALTSAKGKWEFISEVIVPVSNNLSIKFSTPTSGEIRIDDVTIIGSLSTLNKNLNTDNRKLTVSNSIITFTGFTTGNVEIYNTQGKKVFTSVLSETIQPQLSKGFYIVRVGDFRQKISL